MESYKDNDMTDNKLEKVLKTLLERAVSEVKQIMRSKEDLKELEPVLLDYEDSLQLSTILANVIELYFRKVKERLQGIGEDDYRNL